MPPRPSSWLIALSGLPIFLAASWLLRPDPAEPWPAFVRRTSDTHALALLLLVALGVQFEDAHGVTTDGVIYFSQLRSVLFDGDLNVAREFAFLGQPPRPYHIVPIGPTIVWLPLYLIVAGVDTAGRALGAWPEPADPIAVGLTLPYIRAALVSSFAIGAVGLFVVHRHLRGGFDRAASLVTTTLLFTATPLVWYMVYEPSMTHAASFGFVALFARAAARWSSPRITARQSLVLGALLGLAFISRPQEALFALLPAVLLFTETGSWKPRLAAAVRLAGWALAGAAPFLALQAVHTAVLLSRESFSVVGNDGYLDLLHSRWADTLWSSWHGFLSWTPIAYIALIGTAFYLTRAWRWAAATLLIVLLMAWINGSTADWNAGWSFGGRRFVSCLVVLAPGLALVVQQMVRRPSMALTAAVLAVVGWNQLLIAQYPGTMLPSNEPPSFGQIVRQQGAIATRPPFFYPFAFPANVWFAWRTGLPVDRYDLLQPAPLVRSLDLPLDANASRYLMDGWGARAADSWGDLRWIDGPRAEVILPLDLLDDTPATISVQARTRLLSPPVKAIVSLSINGSPAGTLTPDADRPSTSTLTVPSGSAVWTRGFNRFVFETRGEGGQAAPPVAVYRIAIR